MTQASSNKGAQYPDAPALTISNLSKVYPNGLKALDDVSFTVARGGFFALLGPNGAGKSTLINIVSSLLKPSHGSVKIMGIDLETQPSKAKREIGIVPQEFNFNQFEKVFDILVTQAGYYGIPAKRARSLAEKFLKQLGLWEKREAISRSLSGGMKRRLMIARAMMHEPALLILDEPTAGVDIEIRRSMWEFIEKINREEGTTIILTTHYLEEAETLCRDIAILERGKLIQNTTMKELLNTLSVESFIMDLTQPLSQAPKLSAADALLTDSRTLEVTCDKSTSINLIFNELSDQGVEVLSLRNKSNRLEELFMRLVEPHGEASDGAETHSPKSNPNQSEARS